MIPPVEPRKRTIPNAEWETTIQLLVDGQPVSASFSYRHSDAWCARNPNEYGRLIAQAVHDRALPLAKARVAKKDEQKVQA